MKLFCDVRQDHHTDWHAGSDGRDTTPWCRCPFQLLSDTQQAPTAEVSESTDHRAGFLCQSLSEMSPQGAGFPLLSTWGHLEKVAFQAAESSQTSAGAQVRQVATGTWGWCLGHTTCLQPGPKMALEQSAAQKQKPSLTPSWHLLCKKQRGTNTQAVKSRNRQNIFFPVASLPKTNPKLVGCT